MEEELVNDKQEKSYFAKSESKINNTRTKLEGLLENLEKNQPKNSVARRLLILKIDMLRNRLNKQLTRYNIKYVANLKESQDYESFVTSISEKLERLDYYYNRQFEIEKKLESFYNIEDFKSNKIRNQVGRLAPNGYNKKLTGRTKNVRQVKIELGTINAAINRLEGEIKSEINMYKKNRGNVREELAKSTGKLKEAENELKQLRKEELAIVKPSLFQIIKSKIIELSKKFDNWNNKRKQQKMIQIEKENSSVLRSAKEMLGQKTAKEISGTRKENWIVKDDGSPFINTQKNQEKQEKKLDKVTSSPDHESIGE